MDFRGYCVMVPGTHGLWDTWYRNGLADAFAQRGWPPLCSYDRFTWDTKLDGIFGSNDAWVAAGRALCWYLDAKGHNRNKPLMVVAHSHGGQVAAYAVKFGAQVKHLITMATPVRNDLKNVYAVVYRGVERWTHIHSNASDLWQVWGGLFDGKVGVYRKMPNADENIGIPEVGHSGMLEPEAWDKHNLWRLLGDTH